MQEMQVRSLGQEDPLQKGVATHPSNAWRIPWTGEPGYSPWGEKEHTTERLNNNDNHKARIYGVLSWRQALFYNINKSIS